MSWNKAKDALLCAACSMILWVFGEMRTDLKQLTAALEGLTIRMEDVSVMQKSTERSLNDYESRLRVLEKHHRE